MTTFLMAFGIVGTLVCSIIILAISLRSVLQYSKSEKVYLIISFIGLAISLVILPYSARMQSSINKPFQVEIKNIPKGYKFEGYLINCDTGERMNVIEKAE